MDPRFEHVAVGGQLTTVIDENGLLEALVADCKKSAGGFRGRPLLVFDVNGQGLSMRETNVDYRNAMGKADIVHADGMSIVFASKILPMRAVPSRTATTDFIHAASRLAAEQNIKFFLLGGEPGVAERCASRLTALYPRLQIVGARDGYFDQSLEDDLVNEINRSKADVLWIGMGKPYEQVWSANKAGALDVRWIVTCGGCFNFVNGDYKRAPSITQKLGFEWLYRLASNPKKFAGRYVRTSPHAVWLIAREHFKKSGRANHVREV